MTERVDPAWSEFFRESDATTVDASEVRAPAGATDQDALEAFFNEPAGLQSSEFEEGPEGAPPARSTVPPRAEPLPAGRAALPYRGATIALPAGLDADAAAAAAFGRFAAAHDLSAAQVQALVRYEGERVASATAAQSGQERAWREETLRTVSRADLEVAARAVRAHGDPELQQVLEATGLGSHPAIVRLVAKLARGSRADR